MDYIVCETLKTFTMKFKWVHGNQILKLYMLTYLNIHLYNALYRNPVHIVFMNSMPWQRQQIKISSHQQFNLKAYIIYRRINKRLKIGVLNSDYHIYKLEVENLSLKLRFSYMQKQEVKNPSLKFRFLYKRSKIQLDSSLTTSKCPFQMRCTTQGRK